MLEDKQKTVSESNSHGVWVCNKCGWTYPNPHPSAKHRRSHKKHCGKLGSSNVILSPRERSSSPDSDDDLHEEEHSFPAKPVVDVAKSNGTQDQVAEKSVITEVHEISNRVEEEEFADAVTDFSEASQSLNNEMVQIRRNDHPGSVNRSLSGSLFHGQESVAIKTDNGDRGTEGLMGPKSPAGFDSIEISSLQIDSTESLKAERHEDSVGLMGEPVHSHVQHIVGLRKDGLACSLEQDSPIKEAPNNIGGDASVSILNHKGEGHVTQQQSDHILGVEVELPEVTMSSSDLSAYLTTDSVEPKGTSSSTSSLPGAADVETENEPLKNTMAKVCEHDKGHAESEIKIDMSHKYWEGTNESRGFSCYCYEKVVMPSCLEASTEIDDSLKVSVVLSDEPGTKICSERETQDVAPVMQISPEEPSVNETSGSGTVRSVLIDADIGKAVTGICQQHGAKTCDKKSNEDVPISTAPRASPPGHDTNINSDVYEDPNLVKLVDPSVHTINVESEKTTQDDSKLHIACQENVGESGPHVELAPLTSINLGTSFKDSSGGHADPDLTNQGPPVIKALTDIADNSEVGVAYSNRPHIVSSSVTEKEGFAPTQDTKALGGVDREQDLNIIISSNVREGNSNSLECASSIYNAVTVYVETISDHGNACAGHRESPPPTTLSEDKCGTVDSEWVCHDYAVHSGGLGSYPTVAPENATQTVEPVAELVIPVAPEVPTPIMESASEVVLVDPYKVDYAMSNSKKQDDLANRDILVSAASGVLASCEESEVQVEMVHANSVEKEVIQDKKFGSSGESKTEITNRNTDFNKQEISKEHSPSMSSPFDVSSSSTSNILHVVPCIHSDIGPMGCDMPPAVTDDEVTEIRDVIPSEDEKACYAEENILLVYGEQGDQILDLKGSMEKHVVVSSMVYAPAKREHEEEQAPFVPHIQEKLHLELQPNQNHHEYLIDSTGPDMAMHVAEEEKSSQEHLTEACSANSDNPLEDSATKESIRELIHSDFHSDSADGLPVVEQKILPITDDANAIERRESAIPAGDANSSSSYKKTVVVYEELDEQSKDFKGSPNMHVDVSSMVLASVDRELKEDQLPSDPQCHKKVHKKLGSNQNHLDESQNNIKVDEIALHISGDEKSSSAYLTKSSEPCVVSPLEGSSLKEPRPQMVELASSDGTKIKDLQSEDDVTTTKSYVETSASGVNGTHNPIRQMDKVEDEDNFPTGNLVLPPVVVKAEAGNQLAEKADSSVSLKINVVSEAHQNSGNQVAEEAPSSDNLKINVVSEAHQNSGNQVAEEAPSSDNLKINVVSEAHQNSDGADLFEPPSFMTLVEVAGDHGAKLKPPEMKPKYGVQKPTSSATEAVWFPSLPSVVNDSGARKKNEESITKAVNSKRARTPLKNLLVENTEKGGTKVEDLKAAAKGDVKSEGGTLVMKTNTETKVPELESDQVPSPKFKLDPSATNTASTGIISPPKLFGNKKGKRKNRGLHSWMYVCCSSIN